LAVNSSLTEIRWHGRGGQGAVTSAELLAQAVISEGKYAQAFPSFGPERRGAPVQAFNRVDSKDPIRVRAEVARPDVVIVLDPGLMSIIRVAAGLKDTGIAVINTKKTADQIRSEFGINSRIAVVDALGIVREVLGVPIVNTTMLGALVKATGIVNMDSLKKPIGHRFGRLAERNVQAMERAYQETVIVEQ
jgi:pyruvate ferredoxin oxidoreductase gamma subunit